MSNTDIADSLKQTAENLALIAKQIQEKEDNADYKAAAKAAIAEEYGKATYSRISNIMNMAEEKNVDVEFDERSDTFTLTKDSGDVAYLQIDLMEAFLEQHEKDTPVEDFTVEGSGKVYLDDENLRKGVS